jgi:transporter family protein
VTNPQTSWLFWAILSAVFAALTAIFAKVGVEDINSDFATFFRTIVILLVLGGILFVTNQLQPLRSISAKSYGFLCLSGLATGASWVCYFRALKVGNASQVAPIDKLSVVLVAVFGVAFLSEKLSLGNWLGRDEMTSLRKWKLRSTRPLNSVGCLTFRQVDHLIAAIDTRILPTRSASNLVWPARWRAYTCR